MDKLELLKLKADVVSKKLLVFLAIAGGTWIYGIKVAGIVGYLAFVIFIVSAVGLFIGILKLGIIEKEIKESADE